MGNNSTQNRMRTIRMVPINKRQKICSRSGEKTTKGIKEQTSEGHKIRIINGKTYIIESTVLIM